MGVLFCFNFGSQKLIRFRFIKKKQKYFCAYFTRKNTLKKNKHDMLGIKKMFTSLG